MKIDFTLETDVSTSARVKQLGAMFDVPLAKKASVSFNGDLPIENDPWNVGLIVGPSGSGKTSIMRQCFGEPPRLRWGAASVIDDFAKRLKMADISAVCQAVGFNTIPAWMRPYAVLSNGEKFRVEMARRLLETPDPIVMDEFTSVVDRQVGKIGAHAVQKYVRKNDRRFVAVTCHYDVADWLQPDWILEAATMKFERRRPEGRPFLDIEIRREGYDAWRMFAPFHYLTGELHRAASCFVLYVEGRPAAFAGMLHAAGVRGIMRCSRLVTLPDWQGLGLAFVLIEALGGAYRVVGQEVRTYPAHPALIRGFDKSPSWALVKRPGTFSSSGSKTSALRRLSRSQADRPGGGKHSSMVRRQGGRPCAVFRFTGQPMEDSEQAKSLLLKPTQRKSDAAASRSRASRRAATDAPGRARQRRSAQPP